MPGHSRDPGDVSGAGRGSRGGTPFPDATGTGLWKKGLSWPRVGPGASWRGICSAKKSWTALRPSLWSHERISGPPTLAENNKRMAGKFTATRVRNPALPSSAGVCAGSFKASLQ